MAGILQLIEGAAEIAGGAALDIWAGGAGGLGNMLIGAGVGTMVSGVGSMIEGDPVKGFATSTRNPIAPWRVCNGRVRTGGDVVYMNTWGANDQILDLVIVLADHACAGIDELLFDQERIQIDTNAIPTSAGAGYSIPAPAAGSGTSFTPVQQTVNMTSISRSNNVVTVVLPQDIPYLTAGDPIIIQNVPGDPTLNGTFTVSQIVSRVSNVLTFTFLCGGLAATVTSAGQAKTKWVDYGRTVYFEPLLGNQLLGQTFIGMTAGVPWQGTGKLNTPSTQPNAGGSVSGGTAGPNPWTNYCSLQGKTAVFLRIQYDSKYYPSGLPQISFHIRGKNDIYDPRLGPCSGIGTVGLSAAGSGYVASGLYSNGDILNVTQSGASGGQIAVTGVDTSGHITSFVVWSQGTGYSIGSGLAVTGGHGSGAQFAITSLTGAAGTTGYSENPALAIADFLANQTWGYKAVYGTDIPIAALESAANVCDQPVTLAIGGTEPMYALNGQFELTLRRGEILQNMLTSCAGRITPEAPFTLQPSYWVGPGSPALTIDLQAIAAGPYHWKGPSVHELYNGVKGTYISPANKWQSTDYPYYAQDAMHGYSGPSQYGGDVNLATDGGERRWMELNLPFTISPSMAQRIAKIALLRQRWANNGSGTFAVNMAGYQLAPLDVFVGTVAFLGITNQLLEVTVARLTAADHDGTMLLGVEIDVQMTDSSIYVWSTEEELSAQGYVQSKCPAGQVPEYVPRPWSPGYVSPLPGDAIGGPATFGMQPVNGTDAQGNATASLSIKGTPPINALDTGVACPQVTCTGSATGGSLPAGTYVVGISAYDSGSSNHANTDYQNLAVVVVGGSGSGSISVTAVWGSGDDGGDLYMGEWTPDGYVLHYQQTLTPGQTSATITTFNQATPGGPDPMFDHFGVAWKQEIHGGPWAQQVQALSPGIAGVNAGYIQFADPPGGSGMTAGQWDGYTLSLLAKADQTIDIPLVNLSVVASGASSAGVFVVTIGSGADGNLPADVTTTLAIGDLLVMRHRATFTPTSFSDPNIANEYYPTGASSVEAGHIVVVLSGADRGDVQTIAGVSRDGNGNYTIFNLSGSWRITPSTGDIVVICAPSNAPELLSAPMAVSNGSVIGVMAQPYIQNLSNQSWLFLVRTEDVSGNSGPDILAPMREVYLFGAPVPTVRVTANVTLNPTSQNVEADATAGAIVITLPAFSGWLGQDISITKMDATANVVTWQTYGTDVVVGVGTSGTLTAQGQGVTITATQA